MAERIAAAINSCSVFIAEAGTGTGKTFAYLVPALKSGGKVIVSTGTKTLQDQLFNKDLPMVRDALRAPVKIALLKARQLCLPLPPATVAGRWAFSDPRRCGRCAPYLGFCQSHPHRRQGRMCGSLGIIAGLEPRHFDPRKLSRSGLPGLQGVLRHAGPPRGDGGRSGRGQSPPVFADVMLRDEGMAELLPACNTVIFDEAHQLPEVATLFLAIPYRRPKSLIWPAMRALKAC